MGEAKSVYREGCPKCAEHGREVEALRAKLKAAHARPTWVVRFNDEFAANTMTLAVLATLVLGLLWVIAGGEPWVGRLAVVVSAIDAFLGWALWNGRRVDRVLGKGGE